MLASLLTINSATVLVFTFFIFLVSWYSRLDILSIRKTNHG